MPAHRILHTMTRLAAALGRRGLAAVCGETGRRLARAVALTMALALLVIVLYDRGEVPRAAAQPAVGAAVAGSGAGGGSGAAAGGGAAANRRAGARQKDPADHGGLRGRRRRAVVGERPAQVAAAWYAARHGLPLAKVRPLQQDRLSAREVRVLVLADPGGRRLQTALVRVRLGPTGWSVR